MFGGFDLVGPLANSRMSRLNTHQLSFRWRTSELTAQKHSYTALRRASQGPAGVSGAALHQHLLAREPPFWWATPVRLAGS